MTRQWPVVGLASGGWPDAGDWGAGDYLDGRASEAGGYVKAGDWWHQGRYTYRGLTNAGVGRKLSDASGRETHEQPKTEGDGRETARDGRTQDARTPETD